MPLSLVTTDIKTETHGRNLTDGIEVGRLENRNAGLDFVRCFAVLGVLLSHWVGGFWLVTGQLSPGWVFAIGGVSVHAFFALSGLLIGSILFTVCARGPTLDLWRRFMARRWCRTLPLYAAVLATLAAVSADFRKVALQFATMTMNLTTGIPKDGAILGTAWSLMVEEWFYLSFSAGLLGAVYLWGQRAVWPTIIAFVAIPFAARCWIPWDDAYHAVIPNLDSIGYGVVLARLRWDKSPLFNYPKAAFAAGAVLLAFTWMPYFLGIVDIDHTMPSTLTLSSVAWCLILAGAMGRRVAVNSMGQFAFAVAAQSYGLYLIHLPVLLIVNSLVIGGVLSMPVASLLFFTVTTSLAVLGRRWIERPGMGLRPSQFPAS